MNLKVAAVVALAVADDNSQKLAVVIYVYSINKPSSIQVFK